MSPSHLVHVGKESNKLEEVEVGLEHDAESIWTIYIDLARDPWRTIVVLMLQREPRSEFAARCGLSDRQLRNLISGRSRPRASTRRRIIEALMSLDLTDQERRLLAQLRV